MMKNEGGAREQVFRSDISRAETKLQQNPDDYVWQNAYAKLKTIEIYNNSCKLKRLLILLGILYVSIDNKYKLKFSVFDLIISFMMLLLIFFPTIAGAAIITLSVFNLWMCESPAELGVCMFTIFIGYTSVGVGYLCFALTKYDYRNIWYFLRGCPTEYDMCSYTHIP